MNKRKLSEYVETYHLTEQIHENWIDLKNRAIYIHGIEIMIDGYEDSEEPGVEYQMTNKVVKNLHLLRAISDEPITIHLLTCGGDVVQGLAIYDTIKAMPYKVTIISYTHARSMSSYILQAADDRVLMPNSYFLFHDGEEGAYGTKKQTRSYLEFSDKHWEPRLNKIYTNALMRKGKYSHLPAEKISAILREEMDRKEDVYLPAEDAIEWGFADRILHRF